MLIHIIILSYCCRFRGYNGIRIHKNLCVCLHFSPDTLSWINSPSSSMIRRLALWDFIRSFSVKSSIISSDTSTTTSSSWGELCTEKIKDGEEVDCSSIRNLVCTYSVGSGFISHIGCVKSNIIAAVHSNSTPLHPIIDPFLDVDVAIWDQYLLFVDKHDLNGIK